MTELPASPAYRVGAVDLLGVLGYGALTAFGRLADDARLAPSLEDRVEISALAARQFTHFSALRERLRQLGAEPMASMEPFHASFDAFHAHTAPKTWLEALTKAYVGVGFAADLAGEVAAFVDAGTRELVTEVLADDGFGPYVVDRVRATISAQPEAAGRLALWVRRLVGEALSQAQRIAAEREAMTALLTGSVDRPVDRPGADLAAAGRMFTRLVESHAQRMGQLGLQA